MANDLFEFTVSAPGGDGTGLFEFVVQPRRRATPDTGTIEGLVALADQHGLGDQAREIANEQQKMSFLQRLSAGLGAFNPAEALMRVTDGDPSTFGSRLTDQPRLVAEYVKTVGEGLSDAVTGNPRGLERRYFEDVLEAAVPNRLADKIPQSVPEPIRWTAGAAEGLARYAAGLGADIALDPTTYVGGSLARLLTAGARKGATAVMRNLDAAAPPVAAELRDLGRRVTESLREAFIPGAGTTPGVRETLLELSGALAKAKEGLVQSARRRLGSDRLTPEQAAEVFDRLMAGRRAELAARQRAEALLAEGKREASETILAEGKRAAREAARSADPLVNQVIEELIPRSKKFGKQAGLVDTYETYVPALRVEDLTRFGNATAKLKVGSQGYLKRFRDALADDEMIRNLPEAFARREFEMVSDRLVKDTLKKLVRDFGKPLSAFPTEDAARQAGYALVKTKGKFGEHIGYLKEADKAFVDTFGQPQFKSISKLARNLGFDAATALFKRAVTGLFPAFHVRNYVSGHIQNFEVLGADALRPENIAAGHRIAWQLAKGRTGSGTITLRGKTVSLKSVIRPFEKRFGTSSSYIADIADATADDPAWFRGLSQTRLGQIAQPGRALERAGRRMQREAGESFGKRILGKITEETGTTLRNPLSQEAPYFRAARAVGNYIETQQKATAYITALRQGKTVKQALDLAEQAGFDYRSLTPFESEILRRLVPFYAYCVPVETSQALTRDGWVSADDLTVGTEILTYSTERDRLEWQPVEAVNIFEWQGDLVGWKNTRHVLEATPEHRWVFERDAQTVKRPYGTYEYPESRRLDVFANATTQDSVRVVAEAADEPTSLLTPDQAALLGWLLTDGTWRWRGNHCEAVLFQHPNKPTFAAACRAAGRTPTWFHPNGTARIAVRKDLVEPLKPLLRRSKHRDSWVDVVTRLSTDARRAMFDAMYAADGTIGKRTADMIAARRPNQRELLVVLGTLLGYRVTLSKTHVVFSRKQRARLHAWKPHVRPFAGRVWCPTTANGTWVMRQGTIVTITGNSRKNVGLQARTLATNPQRVRHVIQAVENMGEQPTREERAGLPEYLQESFAIKFGDAPTGNKEQIYYSSFGTPVEAFSELMETRGRGGSGFASFGSQKLAQLNPILKAPLEQITGRDFFRRDDLSKITNAKDYRAMPDIVKRWLRYREVQEPVRRKDAKGRWRDTGEVRTVYVADPERLHIIRNMPTSRAVSTIMRLMDDDLPAATRLVQLFTGLKPQEIALDRVAASREAEKRRALEDLLTRYRVGYEMRRFIPKEATVR